MSEPLPIDAGFFRTVVERSPHAVFLVDATGRYRWVNDAACAISGYGREELLARRLQDLHAPEAAEAAASHFDRVRAEGRAEGEYAVLHRDGRQRRWLVDAFGIGDGHFVGIVKDVTEQRRIRAELERERQRLLRAQEVAAVGWWQFDLGAGTVEASDVTRRIYGVAPGVALGIPEVQQIPLPEHREPLDRAMRALVERGEPYDVEFQIRRPRDGAIRAIRSLAEYDPASHRVFGILQDVTGLRRVEARLLASEARLRAIFDSATDFIFLKDRDLRYTHANPACLEFLGLSADELLGQTDAEIFAAEHAAEIQATDRTVLAGRVDRDVVVRRVGDRHVVLETVKVPVRDARGEVVGLCGISRDVTAKRQLEEQLRQAQKMEAIGRLAGGVAHDFNNLLTPILGFADLVGQALPADDPHRGDLEAIARAAERARDLTSQLLAFGRKQMLDMRTLDLNEVVRDSETMLRRLIRENVLLRLALAPDLGAVRADPSQLHNVIINLVVNAADAMPLGGTLILETANVELDARYAAEHPGSHPGPHVMLAVSDDGEGMDPETLAMVFEPFFTTKGLEQGTGLGLATVHGIVKQHAGSVWAYSELGRGSTFKVYLPRATAAAEPLDADEAPSALHGSERILVVEDDDAVRSLATAVLGKYGHTVVGVASPRSALELARNTPRPFDLLLTDVVMPAMNGVQLHRALRGIWPDLPVLYMSGYTTNVIAHHGVLDAGVDFLAKPFTPRGLAGKVREVLDAARR